MSEPAKTYATVLNQIGLYTFSVMCVCVWLADSWAPALFVSAGPQIELEWLKITLPAYPLGVCVFLALVFRLIKLHDRISDLFGIRKRYDYEHVIRPLFVGSKPNAAFPSPEMIHANRSTIMRRTFYVYTQNSGDEVIDGHFIEMVWESLRWFWVVLEAIAVLFAFTFLCLVFGEMSAALKFALILIPAGALFVVAEKHCIRQTNNEVSEILSNPSRRSKIAAAFDEILG